MISLTLHSRISLTANIVQLSFMPPHSIKWDAGQYVPTDLIEQGSIKEVETRSDRLVFMSGIYSQAAPQDFSQPNYVDALRRKEASFTEATTKLV